MFNAGVDTDLGNLQKIGSITAHIAEAADASATGANVADGESGDTDFPHGNMKVLATVGEASACPESKGEMIVGVHQMDLGHTFTTTTLFVLYAKVR